MTTQHARVRVIASGGSIAGIGPHRLDYTLYPELGQHLTIEQSPARILEVSQIAQVQGEDLISVGSTAIGPLEGLKIWERVNQALAEDITGVVITLGGTTLEETAYFLHLTVKSTKPVVVTGAMRPRPLWAPTPTLRGKYVICKITGQSSAEVTYNGAILQQEGEIVEVGSYEELRLRNPNVDVVGSSRYVVMPGLVNDHFHVGLTPFQLGAPDLHLEMWSLKVDPYLDQLYGAVQMIESGTTTVPVIHSPGRGYRPVDLEVADKVVKAYQDSGMRVSYAPSIADQNSMVAGARGGEEVFANQLSGDLAERYKSFMGRSYLPVDEVMPALEEICAKYGNNRHEGVRVTMAPSNVHRCSDAMLVALEEMATKYSTAIHFHLQETAYQKLYGLQAWQTTPLQHLHELGFLGPEVTCGHSVWATDDDIKLMSATGTNVCHNASSNLRLQSRIALWVGSWKLESE